MNIAQFKQWQNRLHTTRYIGTGNLYNEYNGMMCALGHLADLNNVRDEVGYILCPCDECHNTNEKLISSRLMNEVARKNDDRKNRKELLDFIDSLEFELLYTL